MWCELGERGVIYRTTYRREQQQSINKRNAGIKAGVFKRMVQDLRELLRILDGRLGATNSRDFG